MFRDEATEKWRKYNLRRCRSARFILWKVKGILSYEAKRYTKFCDEKDGKIRYNEIYQMTRESFLELKRMCQQEGIDFVSSWKSIDPDVYCFELELKK